MKQKWLVLGCATMLAVSMLSGCGKGAGGDTASEAEAHSSVDQSALAAEDQATLLSVTWENEGGETYAFTDDGTYQAMVGDMVYVGTFWIDSDGSRLQLMLQEEGTTSAVAYDILMVANDQVMLMNQEGDPVNWKPVEQATDSDGNLITFEGYETELAKITAYKWADTQGGSTYKFKEDGTFIDKFAGEKFTGIFWFTGKDDTLTLCMQEEDASSPSEFPLVFNEDGTLSVFDGADYEMVWKPKGATATTESAASTTESAASTTENTTTAQ